LRNWVRVSRCSAMGGSDRAGTDPKSRKSRLPNVGKNHQHSAFICAKESVHSTESSDFRRFSETGTGHAIILASAEMPRQPFT
jgi:hypothetical protein